ncbi:MAG: glycosyltransferase family 4 protein [Candidatus Sungbacteria bacterium]|uniref:Glycosyltransferase family 4 protein n=1 Tax=Candidatus Sungiibacteriota bacterium TaxID=2750080 RepID=A0A932YVW3_9BACT|nr:glycosyltransferase family 4 protein [Candidatus Sungbacteria bacterium]
MTGGERVSIVYVLPRYDPDSGSHFFYLGELLAAAGRHLDIFIIIESVLRPPQNLPGRVYCQRFSWTPLRFMEIMAVMVRERLRGRTYFYTHYSLFGGLASSVVTRLFGGTAYYWNCGLPWLYRRGRLYEAAFRLVMRHTVLVTGTPRLGRQYRERYGLKPECVRILPNWISLARFRNVSDRPGLRAGLGVRADAGVVLFVHRLSRRKGIHLLPEIIARVTRGNKHVIFAIVGAGPEQESLEREVRNRGLADKVKIVGEVPQREISRYFRAADVFLMPSEEEGFPHVLLEAMAAGLPYVASDVGGVREITPPALAEYIVPVGNISELSAKILRLLAQPPHERAAMARAEQTWIARYDLSAVLPEFLKLFPPVLPKSTAAHPGPGIARPNSHG